MGYVFGEIEQNTIIDNIEQKDIDNFTNKHKKTVELFEGEFLKKDSNGKIWVLGSEIFSLNTRDLDTSLKKARMRFFEGAEVMFTPSVLKSVGGFDWGESPFDDNFYNDLANLINERCVEFDAQNVTTGDGGYYSGSYSLWLIDGKPDFNAGFNYYEDEDW